MKCPYCAEEIKDSAIKCKHCGEWLPSTSYFYPADKTKSNFGNLFVLEIEGERISVERTKEGKICVSKGDDIIQEIPKNESGKVTDIEIADHKLSIQYKEHSVLLGMLFWNSGFRIHVDGKPVVRTSADPQEMVKVASYAFFLFAVIALINVFINPNPDARFGAIIFLPVLVVFGLLTRKATIFTTTLGSLYGIFDVISYIVQAFETNYATQHTSWFIFWFLLRGGAALALIQGFVAGIKLRSLKKKFVKK